MIVRPQSPVIIAALRGGFEETASKIITVSEFDVATVQNMVDFLYTGDYKLAPKPEKKPAQHDHDEKRDEGEIDSDEDKMSEDPEHHRRLETRLPNRFIEKLAKISTAKIELILKTEVDFLIIPQIIEEMSTSNRTADLRSLIAPATARYIEELTSSQVLRTIDLEHHLTIEVLGACGERIQQLMEDFSAAHGLKNRYKQAKDLHERGQNLTVAKFRSVIEQLKTTPKCRNCNREFGCYIEEPPSGLTEGNNFVLRCAGCQCRH
ncbi:hypothetical protein FOMA001_g2408 [Fusarium oxysporum f. sp. matthiolae]|nr:hypothetical protein FOMA001_g2408 [Fusarium oxysporum f. sp. matthiolae]